MKLTIIFAVTIALFAFAIPLTNSAQVCIINVRQCAANKLKKVCGRYGTSTRCMSFRNRCNLQLANCNSNIGNKFRIIFVVYINFYFFLAYTLVNNTYCSGVAIGSTATCKGLSTTTSGSTGTINGILSSLFGSSSGSNSNIQPIIIKG